MELSSATVRQAVKTLLCLPDGKKGLDPLPGNEGIQLVISVKKVPIMSRIHVGRFVLPHSLFNADSNVCLFVKDKGSNNNRNFDEIKQDYLDKLKNAGFDEIKEVIPLRQLRLEFQPFEAKRRLSDAFDGFLADERIFNYLRPLLGKNFHDRHRTPATVRLHRGDFEKCVRKALKTSLTTVTKRGPCSMLPVGMKLLNTEDQIVENILCAWDQFDNEIPGGRKNIRSLSIKTAHSMAVPVYSDLDFSDVPVPDIRDYHEEPEPEEIDTVHGAKVVVYPDGRVRLVRKEKKAKKELSGDEDVNDSDKDSDEERDDRVVRKLIEEDEEADARRKRRLERRAARKLGVQPKKKLRRPLLEAHAKAEKKAAKPELL